MLTFAQSARFRPAGLLMVLAVAVAACGGGTPSATGTASPRVSPTPTAPNGTSTPTTPPPTSTPGTVPWPAEWDDAFCAAYADIVVAQELARDIGRALDDDARDDAIGLTHELAGVLAGLRLSLAELPNWEGAEAALAAIDIMLADDDELVTFYLRYLEEDREPALERAKEMEQKLRETDVPAVEEALATLADLGLACPGLNFTLDKP